MLKRVRILEDPKHWLFRLLWKFAVDGDMLAGRSALDVGTASAGHRWAFKLKVDLCVWPSVHIMIISQA